MKINKNFLLCHFKLFFYLKKPPTIPSKNSSVNHAIIINNNAGKSCSRQVGSGSEVEVSSYVKLFVKRNCKCNDSDDVEKSKNLASK